MLAYKEFIEVGDDVVLYIDMKDVKCVKVCKDEIYQTKFGALKHNDLIGIKYGSKVQCSKGYAHVHFLTPEVWTEVLPHRTQILYIPDISLIVMNLDLVPGSIVVESGTGSGSLSHAIIRTIAPKGHLYTYDFHQIRKEKAEEEFSRHGLSGLVTCRQADVCVDGFGLEGTADAVFLDLPTPWLAVDHSRTTLKQAGRLCSFSPCIEQVQRTCDKLSNSGFVDLTTLECLVREHSVTTVSLPFSSGVDGPSDVNFRNLTSNATNAGHTGYLTFASLFAPST